MQVNRTVQPVAPRLRAAAPVGAAAAAAQPRPLAASVRVAARAGDPLPTFKSSEEYKNYVINLVAMAQATDADLQGAIKDREAGKGSKPAVDTARERLDAIKLQLAVLRDNYPIPSKWSRPKWLFGQGFNKDKFWRAQVEAIPGKPVHVTPPAQAPAPAPAPAPVKAPRPAAPAAPGSELPEALRKTLRKAVTEGMKVSHTDTGMTYMRAKADAVIQATQNRQDPLSRELNALMSGARKEYDAQSGRDYWGLKGSLAIAAELLKGGALDERARAAVASLAAEGGQGQHTDTGMSFMRAKLGGVLLATEGRAGAEHVAARKLADTALRTFDGKRALDHQGLKTTLLAIEATAGKTGTLDQRLVDVARDLAKVGPSVSPTDTGISFMRAHLQTIVTISQVSGDGKLKEAAKLASDALSSDSTYNKRDYHGLKSTFDLIQATLA